MIKYSFIDRLGYKVTPNCNTCNNMLQLINNGYDRLLPQLDIHVSINHDFDIMYEDVPDVQKVYIPAG